MARKAKKYRISGKTIILMTSIILTNMMGISYAVWNGGLDIGATIGLGTFDVAFDRCYIENIQGEGDLSVRRVDEDTIELKGEVSPDFEGTLNYSIVNKGSIPAYFEGESGDIPESGVMLALSKQQYAIKPDGGPTDSDNSQTLQIHAESEGEYSFEIQLPFSQ